jgi:protein subunit release factor A
MVDGRNRHKNERAAWKEMERRLKEAEQEKRDKAKKEKRDKAIHDTKRIRTYDFSRGIVTDHRTGKSAPLKRVLEKGDLDCLR